MQAGGSMQEHANSNTPASNVANFIEVRAGQGSCDQSLCLLCNVQVGMLPRSACWNPCYLKIFLPSPRHPRS